MSSKFVVGIWLFNIFAYLTSVTTNTVGVLHAVENPDISVRSTQVWFALWAAFALLVCVAAAVVAVVIHVLEEKP